MKRRQVISAVMAMIMGISLLTGCGGKTESSVSTDTDTVESPADTVSDPAEGQEAKEVDVDLSEPVELVWYLVGTPQDDQNTVFEEVNKVLKEKLNTTVEFNIIDWGSYDEKMNVIIATGEDYDMCFTSDWTNIYNTNAQKDAYYPLGGLLDKYGTHILEQVPGKYWDATKIGGEIYGVVNYQIMARVKGMSFPEDTVEEIGYDISQIHSYADLTDYFAAAKEAKPDMIPFMGFVGTTEMPALFTDETGFSIDYLQGPLAVRAEDPAHAFNAIESEEFMEFCKMTRDWYDKGYVRKDAASISDGKAELKTHNYASYSSGVGLGSSEGESAIAGYPIVQAQTVPAYVSTGSIQAALTAINVKSEHPERAMMVLDYLFEDKDLYNMLCYGIEGKHYVKYNDYSITLNEDAGYNPGISWEFGSWFNAMLLEGEPEDHWDLAKEVNESALTSPVLGFVYDSSNVKNEMAQITALISEYLPGFLTGSLDPETKIPELVEKMNAAGMDKIIEDANAQLAAWKN